MRGLRALLDDPGLLLNQLAVSVPEPLAITKAARALEAIASEPAANVDVATLQAAVALAVHEDRLQDLSRRDLREACRAFLHPPTPPGGDRAVGTPLLREVERLKRRAAMLALIDCYLDRFQTDNEDVAELGARLTALCAKWPWRQSDEWPERQQLFSIFDAKKAPEKLAQAILASDLPPIQVLAGAGLQSEGRLRGGLAEAAFKKGCELVLASRKAALPAAQLRLIQWGRLRSANFDYPRAWKEFAAAIFQPWIEREPPVEHKKDIIEAAVSYAGDPRIRPAKWAPVKDGAPRAFEVIVRWLTKASVEQFFDIVAETTDRPDMWAERRKFWEDYLHGDCISAAWVAFGSDGAWRAELAATRNPDAGFSMFGRLATGGGRTSEHAALIMRIGELTVVEWSHNGRWNIWKAGEKGAPALFRHNNRRWSDYEPRELMNAPTSGPHLGYWQWKVSQIIRDQTGMAP